MGKLDILYNSLEYQKKKFNEIQELYDSEQAALYHRYEEIGRYVVENGLYHPMEDLEDIVGVGNRIDNITLVFYDDNEELTFTQIFPGEEDISTVNKYGKYYYKTKGANSIITYSEADKRYANFEGTNFDVIQNKVFPEYIGFYIIEE